MKPTLPKTEPNQPWYPWSVQVELVQGCNRRCWFCGIPYVPRERQLGHNSIPLDVLRNAFEQLAAWLPKIRVEINSHGEPTLHPQFFDCLRVMRSAFPGASLQLQTNSDLWFKHDPIWYIERMWAAGLDALILNNYAPGRHEFWRQTLTQAGMPFTDYYYDNPNNESGNRYRKPGSKFILLWDDLATVNATKVNTKTGHSNKKLHNSGGTTPQQMLHERNGQPIVPVPTQYKCSKVFRELILNWDGTIPICCQDWMDVTLMGDTRTQHIRDIWFSERFNLVRSLTYRRRRDVLEPCAECIDPTTRVGLIPEPLWPEVSDEELIERYQRLG